MSSRVTRAKAETHNVDAAAHFYGYGVTRVRRTSADVAFPVGLWGR